MILLVETVSWEWEASEKYLRRDYNQLKLKIRYILEFSIGSLRPNSSSSIV